MSQTFWNDRPVFVTGATGIVGSWVVKELLRRKARVVALVRDLDPQSELLRSGDLQKISVVQGCLEDYDSVERCINDHDVDTVFHFGAQPIVATAVRSPLPTFESNVRGTYNLLEATRRMSTLVKRVVVASTDKSYGDSDVLPYTEDMRLNACHPYDVSKACADLITQAYAKTYGLPASIARCGNIYGGGDLNWSRIVPGTIRSLNQGERPILRSDGKMLRDYIYVQDVVEGYLRLAELTDREQNVGEAYNFGPGRGLSVLELVEKITSVMGARDLKPVILNQAQGEILNQYLDSSKAAKNLGWKNRFTLEQGLSETVKWYQEFLK